MEKAENKWALCPEDSPLVENLLTIHLKKKLLLVLDCVERLPYKWIEMITYSMEHININL